MPWESLFDLFSLADGLSRRRGEVTWPRFLLACAAVAVVAGLGIGAVALLILY